MSDSKFSLIFKIFSIVMILLLVVSLFRNVLGAESVYFSSFLDMIADVPTVKIPLSFSDLTIYADWGLFNFFRDMLNLSSAILTVLVFGFTGLLNIIVYILYFIRYLFAV